MRLTITTTELRLAGFSHDVGPYPRILNTPAAAS